MTLVASGGARYRKLTAERYHADRSAISRSMLWRFRERRRLFETECLDGQASGRKPTTKMDIGTLCHAGLLHPHTFEDCYAVFPADVLDKRGYETTNAAEAFRAQHESAGKVVLKQHDFDTVRRVIEAVIDKIGPWLELPSKREQAIYWENPDTGLPCKTMTDWLILPGGSSSDRAIVLDFKVTEDCQPAVWKWRVEEHGYWLQDAHYREGVALVTGLPVEFYFVVPETKGTHEVTIQRLKPSDVSQAARARLKLLRELQACIDSGDFSEPWADGVAEIDLRPSCFGV